VAQPFQAVQAQAAPNGKPGPDGQPAPDEQPASDEQPATDVGTARGGEYAADLPPAWLEVSPQIAFPIIDRLLGGSGKEWYVPCRACTAIERRLLHRVGEAVAEGLSRAGPDGGAESLRWRCAAEAAELPDSSQTGPVVLAKFTLSMGRQAGALRLCLPRGLLARLLPAAATDGPPEAAARPAGTAPPHGQTAARQAGPLELSVVVQDIAISREELAQIEEGDILMTDTAEGGEVLVRIGGIPRFYARLGVSNGRKAIQITRRVDERR
jgi:flagellar motor switch protein FliM